MKLRGRLTALGVLAAVSFLVPYSASAAPVNEQERHVVSGGGVFDLQQFDQRVSLSVGASQDLGSITETTATGSFTFAGDDGVTGERFRLIVDVECMQVTDVSAGKLATVSGPVRSSSDQFAGVTHVTLGIFDGGTLDGAQVAFSNATSCAHLGSSGPVGPLTHGNFIVR